MFTILQASSTVTAWSICYAGQAMSMASLQELSTKQAATVAAPVAPVATNGVAPAPAAPVVAPVTPGGACAQAVSPKGDVLLVTNCGGASAPPLSG